MTTKIKIDLANGLVEVEGSEEFARVVYDDFKGKFSAEPVALRPPSPAPDAKVLHSNSESRPKAKKRVQQVSAQTATPKKRLQQPTSIKTLDLSNGAGGRLRDFYDQFEIKTNFERNLVFLYFLQQKMGIEDGITQDHIFTCYRDIPGIKVPGALRQSLLDTDQDKGWIDASDPWNLKVNVHGLNYLEHDLPKKPEA